MKILFSLIFLSASLHSFTQALRNNVVIDEIMADPSPPALLTGGLPEAEYIELKNISRQSVNLNGWKISDATTTATITANFILQPDSFLVICSNSAAPLLSGYGATIGVSNFPSLDNDGEIIYLRSKDGKLIYGLQYEKSWYKNAVKSEGGWSLEMIDTKNTCSGYSNWKASVHQQGGSPGKKNSVDALNKDELPPLVLRAYATDSLNITVIFDEPLDSLPASLADSYLISDDIGVPLFATVAPPLFNSVSLRLKLPLKINKVYTVSAKNISDCSGNSNGPGILSKVGLASLADTFDIVINEILFNPRPEGVDYIEIYNRSNSIVDLNSLYIANRLSNGMLNTLRQLSSSQHLLFPKDFYVVTENAMTVKKQYVSKNPDAFVEISMPSLPDDRGTIVLMSRAGKTVDELAYDEKWHFKLLDNKEGVALERVDYNKPTQDSHNWHSAATDAGYGTPTYRNSQFNALEQADAVINITPSIFSPDNDGFDDFLTISYQFLEPGYTCNIILYDANGRAVRFLCRNALCGPKGYFRWDGLDEKSNRLNAGIYIVMTEVFNLSGKVKRFKNTVVLARKLK